MNTFLKSEEFDDWLTHLKDQVGKAIIISASDPQKPGILAMANRWVMALLKCGFISGPAIACISPGAEMCLSAADG